MPSYKIRAIILKRRNQGESDRVLTLFSREFGKINAIAKGCRKSKSKLAGSCELFTISDFVLSHGKSFEIVAESSPILYFNTEEIDLNLVNLAHFFAEVVATVTIEKQASEDIYEALSDTFANIENIDYRILIIYFCSKILNAIGSSPELSGCLMCGKKPDTEVIFSYTAGGIFCGSCKPTAESLLYIDKDIIKLWRFIGETSIEKLLKLRIEDRTLDEAAHISQNFLCNITGREYCTMHNLQLTKKGPSSII